MGEPCWLWLDPGGESKKHAGTTGWALFTPQGKLIDMGYEIGNEAVRTLVDNYIWDCEGIGCENWRLRPDTARFLSWSDMPTSKLIGWIEGVCYMKVVPFVLQEPANKTNGYKFWGKKPLPKSNPMNHAYDAVAHGYYYFTKEGIIV